MGLLPRHAFLLVYLRLRHPFGAGIWTVCLYPSVWRGQPLHELESRGPGHWPLYGTLHVGLLHLPHVQRRAPLLQLHRPAPRGLLQLHGEHRHLRLPPAADTLRSEQLHPRAALRQRRANLHHGHDADVDGAHGSQGAPRPLQQLRHFQERLYLWRPVGGRSPGAKHRLRPELALQDQGIHQRQRDDDLLAHLRHQGL